MFCSFWQVSSRSKHRQADALCVSASGTLTAMATSGKSTLEAETVDLQAFGKLVLPGREYRYIQNDLPLDIKMRYEVETDGDFKSL